MVSIVVAPWNYPFNLVIAPLAAALAAGAKEFSQHGAAFVGKNAGGDGNLAGRQLGRHQ